MSPALAWRSRLTAAAFAALVLAGITHTYSARADYTPTLQTDEPSYAAGDEVTFAGQGFAPGETVTLSAVHADGTAEPGMGHDAWTATADPSGALESTWSINAADVMGRRFVVRAVGAVTGGSASPAFLRAPQVAASGSTVVAGEPVSISGRDFVAGEAVTVQVTHADGTAEPGMEHEASLAMVQADGSFALAWSPVKEDLAGPLFAVIASGSVSGAIEPVAITRVAVVQPDKGDYQPGDTALVYGRGFAPGEVVELHVEHASGQADGNGHQPLFVNANADGELAAAWYVDPDDSLGSRFIVHAEGQASGAAGAATFTDAGTVSLTALGTAYSQNFDTLASTGTSSALPTGWEFAEAGTITAVNGLYTAGTGSSNAGDTYSFGATGSTERAFGGLLSGSLAPRFGAQFTNNTGGTITSLVIAYTGEQWRLGQVTAGRAADRLDFQLSTDATSLTTGLWTDYNPLDFSSPVVAGTVGALVGNNAANRTALNYTITGLNIPNGFTLWIRWIDVDLAPGSDDGLAVDDFSLTPAGIAAQLPSISINDVSIAEGNAGTTNLTFTVGLSAAAPAGGVTFDIASADGTAVAPGDYVSKSLASQTISAGQSTYTFTVQVNGDTTGEVDETFVVNVTNVVGATVVDAQGQGTITNDDDTCQLPYTPIYEIQGTGATVALTGTRTTKGVVVGDYEGAAPALRGFFIQDLTGDGNPATSDGLFVFEGSNANTVNLGDVVRVTGTAGENQGQSQISVGTITKCGTGAVTPVDVTLPVASLDTLEQYEGMLVRFPQALTVTEHFQLGRFGQVTLSSGRLQQPTNVVAPGAPALALQAQNNLNRIILDDASQAQNPDPIVFARGGLPLSATNTLRGGDTATGIVGVLNYTFGGNATSPNAYRVRPGNALGGTVNFVEANSRPASPPNVGGTVRVVGMNLLNFFNTFTGCTNGVSGVPTDCRGANNQLEFDRQWPKTVAAITAMNPDVVGVNELENDGYGPSSALQFLVNKLNEATAPGTYAFIDVDANTGQVDAMGDDAIRVATLYKPAVVSPVGASAALNSNAFVSGGDSGPRNRASLAQAFSVNSTGATFILNVNHLKSKGSACGVPDAGDGQGNCVQVRVNAANALAAWLASDPTGTGDPDVLMVGDYNSYAQEAPITALKNSGFTNLIETILGPDAYSYVFDGQWGYLDHALASASLVSQVSGVGDYHINSDEPSVLDYNTDFKTANLITTLYAPDQFRISDHDPVVIGLTPNAAPTVSAGPFSVAEGGSVSLSATGVDPNGDSLTYAWDFDNNGSFESAGATPTFSAVGLDGPSSVTVKVQVTDPGGLTGNASATITVSNVAPTVSVVTVAPEPSVEGQAVIASATFSDPANVLDAPFTCTVNYGDGSGVLAGSVTSGTCTGPSHVYSSYGTYTVTVTVTDNDGGVSAPKTATHDVNFTFSGFFAPIDNLPTVNRVKAGQAIPVKFSLGGAKGLQVLSSVTAALVACDGSGGADDIKTTVTAGASSLAYDAGTATYIYVWKTDKAWAGQCRLLNVTTADGESHTARFNFTR